MKRFAGYIAALLLATSVGGAVVATVPVATARAADCSGKNIILTLPAWYRNLAEPDGKGCKIKNPGTTQGTQGLTKFVWTIVLNIIDMLMQIVGYVAVGFIIYGGFVFMTSMGSPENSARARKIITNAVIGVIIAVMSVALVNLIAGGLNV